MGQPTSGGPVVVLSPVDGLVEAVVGLAVFAALLDALTPTLVAALAGPPVGIGPALGGLLTALALWAVAGLTAVGVILDQREEAVRRFPNADAYRAFLASSRPRPTRVLAALVLGLVGGSVATLTWGTAVGTLEALLDTVVPAGAAGAGLAVADVLATVAFALASAAFARGLDRLVLGGYRELRFRIATENV